MMINSTSVGALDAIEVPLSRADKLRILKAYLRELSGGLLASFLVTAFDLFQRAMAQTGCLAKWCFGGCLKIGLIAESAGSVLCGGGVRLAASLAAWFRFPPGCPGSTRSVP